MGAAASVQQVIALREAVLERSRSLQELQQAQRAQGPGEANGTGAVIGGAGIAGAGGAGSFGDTLRGALAEVNAAQQRSSDISAAYERGEVQDVTQVMLARQESSVAFEATLQVRNKLLSAYQDIMRMGI